MQGAGRGRNLKEAAVPRTGWEPSCQRGTGLTTTIRVNPTLLLSILRGLAQLMHMPKLPAFRFVAFGLCYWWVCWLELMVCANIVGSFLQGRRECSVSARNNKVYQKWSLGHDRMESRDSPRWHVYLVPGTMEINDQWELTIKQHAPPPPL